MQNASLARADASHRAANIRTLIAREQGAALRGGGKKFVDYVRLKVPESNLTTGFVSQFVNGYSPVPNERAAEIERAYGLEPGTLDLPNMGGAEVNPDSDNDQQQEGLPAGRKESQTPSNYVTLKLFDTPISKDDDLIQVNPPELLHYVEVLRGYMESIGIKYPENIDVVQMRGQSMGSTAPHGCVALVDRTKRRFDENEGVYVLRWHSGIIVKRLTPDYGDHVLVQSDNPDKARYPTHRVPRAEIDKVNILAQVVFVIKGHRVI